MIHHKKAEASLSSTRVHPAHKHVKNSFQRSQRAIDDIVEGVTPIRDPKKCNDLTFNSRMERLTLAA